MNLEPDFSLTITRADNGYICERIESLIHGDVKEPITYRTYYHVISGGEMDDDASEMVNLLYYVSEYFGETGVKIGVKK